MSLVGFPEFPVFISLADSLVRGRPAPRITPAGRHTLHSRSPPLSPAVTPTVSPGFTTHPQTHISPRPPHSKVCDALLCAALRPPAQVYGDAPAQAADAADLQEVRSRPARPGDAQARYINIAGLTCEPGRQVWECLHCTAHTFSLSSDDVRFITVVPAMLMVGASVNAILLSGTSETPSSTAG